MRIAFDLDGTLIPAPGSVMRTERLGLLARLISSERLREDAPGLFQELQQQGHEVWLYTTSLRGPNRLRLWFASIGVRLDGIVNQARHASAMKDKAIHCSKYPPAFGIDLLIDDADGVRLEGERYGFSVLHIHKEDTSWCLGIKEGLRDAISREESRFRSTWTVATASLGSPSSTQDVER
jgi:hypothetical protein